MDECVEGEGARSAGRDEYHESEDNKTNDEEPRAAHPLSAPPHDDPWPAVQP